MTLLTVFSRLFKYKIKLGKNTTLPIGSSTNVSNIYNYDTLTAINQIAKNPNESYVYSNEIMKAMCYFSSLCYENQADNNKYIAEQNGKIVYYSDDACMYSFNNNDKNIVILAFSGTRINSLSDWWTNLTRTYRKEWEEIKPDVLRLLNILHPDKFIVCGHSKGGVEAILCFKNLIKLGVSNLSGCYAIAAPDLLIKYERERGIYNMKHVEDPVACILGKERNYWEILRGKFQSFKISRHHIYSYFDYITLN